MRTRLLRIAVLAFVLLAASVGVALAAGIGWGQSGDVPVHGDFDGNGTDDIAVFRSGQWYVKDQPPYPQIWGTSGDIPVPGDYDGNGTADIAVFRPSDGGWYVKGQPPFPQIWGASCDIPQPLPYAIRSLIPRPGCANG
jgi:hypothetical protein